MIGLEKNKVRLAEYDEDWAVEFENEKNAIQRAISDYKIEIEHIGSTSVESLCSKPIIDILIGIENFNDGFKCVSDLELIGYEAKGENGIPGRHFFAKGNPRTHHLHMVEINSNFWKEHLLFRDYLRNNSDIRIQYSELKKELALKYKNNREEYTSSKSEFIQVIIKKAKEDSKIENYKNILKRYVSDKTFEHSIAVMNEMEQIAEIYDLPVIDAKLVGLFHDIAKDLDIAEVQRYINILGIDQNELDKYSNVYLHGPIGAHILKELFPEFNKNIINAIKSHTFYTSDGENTLSWCLHLADVLAPTHEWLGMKKLKNLVYSRELERSSLLLTGWLIEYFNESKAPISDYLNNTFEKLKSEIIVEDDFFVR